MSKNRASINLFFLNSNLRGVFEEVIRSDVKKSDKGREVHCPQNSLRTGLDHYRQPSIHSVPHMHRDQHVPARAPFAVRHESPATHRHPPSTARQRQILDW